MADDIKIVIQAEDEASNTLDSVADDVDSFSSSVDEASDSMESLGEASADALSGIDTAAESAIGAIDSVGDSGAVAFQSLGDTASAAYQEMSDSVNAFAEENKSAFQKMTAAGGIAFASLLVGAKKSTAAFNTQAQAEAQVANQLKNLGDEATRTLDDMKERASALQATSIFGDEEILDGVQKQLLKFRNIGEEAFTRTEQASIDLAAAMGTGLSGSANKLGRALEDPIKGMTLLERDGVILNESQQDLIKSMVEMGDVAGAQAIILGAVEERFAGSAQAAQDAGTGGFGVMARILGDISEKIGQSLMPMLNAFSDFMTPLLIKLDAWAANNQTLVGIITVVGIALTGLVTAVGLFGLALPLIIGLMGTVATTIGLIFSPIGLLVAAIVGLAFVVSQNREFIKTLTIDTFNAISDALSAFWQGFTNMFSTQIELLKTIWTALTAFFTGDWETFSESILLAIDLRRQTLVQIFNTWLLVIKTMWTALWTGIKTVFTATRITIKTTFIAMRESLKALVVDGVNFITNFFSSSKQLMSDSFENMFSGIGDVGKTVLNGTIGIVESFINMTINMINRMLETINKIGGKVGIEIALIPNISLGRLAHGGIAGKGMFGGDVMGYANGGVVQGPGGLDNVPAMLTAGEVVLNAAQQSNLAGNLNGGGGGNVSLVISGNSFFGTSEELAQDTGELIMEEFKSMGYFESF